MLNSDQMSDHLLNGTQSLPQMQEAVVDKVLSEGQTAAGTARVILALLQESEDPDGFTVEGIFTPSEPLKGHLLYLIRRLISLDESTVNSTIEAARLLVSALDNFQKLDKLVIEKFSGSLKPIKEHLHEVLLSISLEEMKRLVAKMQSK